MLRGTKPSILLPFAATLAKVHLTLQTVSEVKQHYCQAGVKLESSWRSEFNFNSKGQS